MMGIEPSLHGKTALVTGSTSGIGLGIARALAQQGANVILNGLGDTAPARDAIGATGVRVGFHGADLAKSGDITDLFRYAEAEFGGVDVLVNNAGIQHVAMVDEFPPERWDAILALNLTAVFHTTRLALPHMKVRNWGRIINIASVHGQVASVGKAAYVAAKHGVLGLTKVTALETARLGVTCNAICPGWVLTPLVQQQVESRAARDNLAEADAREALLAEKQPSASFVTTDQIGAAVLFLCSEAASQMRGAAWTIDGGWTSQ
jgi:3-hydroxybutyrate dehydrogenase